MFHLRIEKVRKVFVKLGAREGFASGMNRNDNPGRKSAPSNNESQRRFWSASSSSSGYLSNPGRTPLVEKTLGQLLGEAAERFPERYCLVSTHQKARLTFADVLKRVDKFAAGLKKIGLKKGDRIGVWGPNTIEWYIAFMAAARGGFKIVGMNPADQLAEIEYAVNKVGMRAVVIAAEKFKTQNYPEMLLAAKPRCPTLEHIVVASDNHVTGCRRFIDVESSPGGVEVEAVRFEQREIDPRSGATIQFTSGTTGRPKAAEVAHMSYVNNSMQGCQRLGLNDGRNTVCLNVPFFHAFGLVMGHVATLCSGSTIVVAGPSFNPRESLDAIVREKCNVIYGTPTMWVDLINLQDEVNAPIGKISAGLTGGAPASPDLFRRIRETLRLDDVKSIYGLSETTAICFQCLPDTPREIAETTVGYLSDHTEAQVVDENGDPVPFDTPGELWVRGYHTMIGYWEDEENTRKTVTPDGWLKTGDQFVLRPDGYGKVVGRLKDMLIRGGENIFPKEIEDFLETHPGVVEAHVFGVHDDRMGEEICACLRTSNGVELNGEEIRKYGRGKIAHYKIPKYINFTDELPKTTSGKIKKHVLRQELEIRGVVPKKPTSS